MGLTITCAVFRFYSWIHICNSLYTHVYSVQYILAL